MEREWAVVGQPIQGKIVPLHMALNHSRLAVTMAGWQNRLRGSDKGKGIRRDICLLMRYKTLPDTRVLIVRAD